MNRIKLFFIQVFGFLAAPLAFINAQSADERAIRSGDVRLTKDRILDLLVDIRDYITAIFAIVAVIFFLFAAFKYLTSGGNPENADKAKNMVKYGIYAIAVAFLAYTAIELVESFLR